MSRNLKILIVTILTAGLAFGFGHHLTPHSSATGFERLHIFLFNLCGGSTVLLLFSEGRRHLSLTTGLFFFLAVGFTLAATFEFYTIAMLLPLPLALLVEYIRTQTFGRLWPAALFSGQETAAAKFHQAALLCLSLSLVFSSFVIANNSYFHLFSLEKFALNTFFLAFSFPLSLITMAVIFSRVEQNASSTGRFQTEICFWGVNLGVIVFFLFILAHQYIPQLLCALLLFFIVLLICYLYVRLGSKTQEKTFLGSGLLFLLITSVSGISYILLKFSTTLTPETLYPLLRLHAFTALYGWNLSGLAVICRRGDFPITLHSGKVIILHWLTVVILCPLGYFFAPVAVVAVVCYVILLFHLFLNRGVIDTDLGDSLHTLPHR
ncbi:MAG: hypothetical protein ABFS19_08335 [Thermodesulfobacteriota bacterium]